MLPSLTLKINELKLWRKASSMNGKNYMKIIAKNNGFKKLTTKKCVPIIIGNTIVLWLDHKIQSLIYPQFACMTASFLKRSHARYNGTRPISVNSASTSDLNNATLGCRELLVTFQPHSIRSSPKDSNLGCWEVEI